MPSNENDDIEIPPTGAPFNNLASGPVGRGSYVVSQGECLYSIAYESGFAWQTLWDHPDNAQLKQVRKSPNMLLAGDRVTIPPLRLRKVNASTGSRHRFRLKGVPQQLLIRLLDAHDKPRKQLDYTLQIEGTAIRGTTDANGQLTHSIPPNAMRGRLLICEDGRREEIILDLGHLDPLTETTGIQMRLLNLGYDCGEPDGLFGPRTSRALASLQRAAGLDPTGAPNDATLAELKTRHGS